MEPIFFGIIKGEWPSGASPAAMIFIKAMKPVPRDCSLHKKQLFL